MKEENMKNMKEEMSLKVTEDLRSRRIPHRLTDSPGMPDAQITYTLCRRQATKLLIVLL